MSCFIYYGHFYRLTIGDDVYHCRSTLEIIRSCNQEISEEVAQDPGMLLICQPDAVFVMLNPGSSHPRNVQEPSNSISPYQIDNNAKSNLVLAYPDPTQKAIETVMSRKQFNHVRVLNLFDIRERNSARLVSKIRTSLNCRRLPNQPEIKPYSIFSRERRSEFRIRLNARNRIVIAAWGITKARPFFRKCFQILKCNDPDLRIHGQRPVGRRSEVREFYHPSRRRNIWADHVVNNWPGNT